jgi:hypothetical protein
MKMGHQFRVLEEIEQLIAEPLRFNGGYPYPEIARKIQDLLHQAFEIQAFEIIPANIHTRQDNLFKSMSNDFPDVLKDIFHRPAYGPATDFGDDTKGAKVIATVLYLDIAAGVEGIVGGFKPKKVSFKLFWIYRLSLEMGLDDLKDGAFLRILNKIGDPFHLLQLLFLPVYHTAGNNGDGMVWLPCSLVDSLA